MTYGAGGAGGASRTRRTHGSTRTIRPDHSLDYGGDFQNRRDFDNSRFFDRPTRDGG